VEKPKIKSLQSLSAPTHRGGETAAGLRKRCLTTLCRAAKELVAAPLRRRNSWPPTPPNPLTITGPSRASTANALGFVTILSYWCVSQHLGKVAYLGELRLERVGRVLRVAAGGRGGRGWPAPRGTRSGGSEAAGAQRKASRPEATVADRRSESPGATTVAMDFDFLYDPDRDLLNASATISPEAAKTRVVHLLAPKAASRVSCSSPEVRPPRALVRASAVCSRGRGGDIRPDLPWSGSMFEYLMPRLLPARY